MHASIIFQRIRKHQFISLSLALIDNFEVCRCEKFVSFSICLKRTPTLQLNIFGFQKRPSMSVSPAGKAAYSWANQSEEVNLGALLLKLCDATRPIFAKESRLIRVSSPVYAIGEFPLNVKRRKLILVIIYLQILNYMYRRPPWKLGGTSRNGVRYMAFWTSFSSSATALSGRFCGSWPSRYRADGLSFSCQTSTA